MPTCDLFLAEHEPDTVCDDPSHREALALIAARPKGPEWSPIVRGRDGGGLRDFLDGEAIHCGACVELQAYESRSDDVGSYNVRVDLGTLVRYELEWRPDNERVVVLYADVGGFTFKADLDPWMRFRWPRRD